MNRSSAFKSMLGILAVTVFSVQAHAASVTVNTEIDASVADSECSLREAIQSVNVNAALGGCVVTGSGTIDTVELPAGNYNLTITGIDDNNAAGDLDVVANLTLNGAGAESTVISAQGLQDGGVPDRVLHINPQAGIMEATINDVTIRDGSVPDTFGGGILVMGNLEKKALNGLKLGVLTNALATLNGLNVVENEGSDGGGVASYESDIVIQNSTIADNVGTDPDSIGGGLVHYSRLGAGEVSVIGSVVDNNQSYAGAGIAALGPISIDTTTVSNNTGACFGGGAAFSTGAFITNSTFSDNEANGECPDIEGSTEFQNLGGGILVTPNSPLTMVNSTISGNSAINGGGGIAVGLEAPEPPAPAPIKMGQLFDTLNLLNVTITDNSTDGEGGGILATVLESTGETSGILSVANSILANNQASTGADCSAEISSGGYNLVGDSEGCNGFTATGDLTGVDPDLGPLQDNGGPTFTHALIEGSPAIDSANPEGCLDQDGNVLDQDQRGSTRPVNATGLATAICDRGAFEFQVEPTPTPTPTPAPGFLLNGTGCSLVEFGTASASAPALLALISGLSALAYRGLRRRSE